MLLHIFAVVLPDEMTAWPAVLYFVQHVMTSQQILLLQCRPDISRHVVATSVSIIQD